MISKEIIQCSEAFLRTEVSPTSIALFVQLLEMTRRDILEHLLETETDWPWNQTLNYGNYIKS